ncbi:MULTISPECIES: hypothetical protein [Geobacillus]|nr:MULTISPECIES: hypothetical protein [Geobacillus]QIZ67178.1 hypothetical protein HF500_07955 [Geobacillus subterraneus]WPZ19358.1 hypothetical protein UM396_05465 [Geobacillus subterraneus]
MKLREPMPELTGATAMLKRNGKDRAGVTDDRQGAKNRFRSFSFLLQ